MTEKPIQAQVAKTLGEQMADLLRRKPKNFDVSFSVGPDKVEVEAVKFVLKAASPVFEAEFDDNWEKAGVTGIPLPGIDPIAFQLFVNLLILDAWSLDSIKSLNLSPNNLLSLLGLCRRYEITKAIQNLEEAADDFIRSFEQYKDTDDFLNISRGNLETIFSFEKLPLDETEIFGSACRWASNQCTIRGLEPTGENYRAVLGTCLFEIRFPTMSTEEFAQVGLSNKNVLKGEEKLAIYEYTGLDTDEKNNYDEKQLHFKTNPRKSHGCSVLSLPSQYKLTTSPAFECNGSQHHRCFLVNEKISLRGIGFLGPIDGDGNFAVTVQVKRYVSPSYTFDSGKCKKNIFAPKGQIFYFLLDEPIVVEPSTYDSSWQNRYDIFFWMEGANNVSQYKVEHPHTESLEASGVHFHLSNAWNNGNPLAELLFKKI